ncbi:hypothetical protein BYT27DRAFT_7084271, partial [Phlegmacium glaucopus]
NMAAIVWSMLELYKIENKIIAIMMDNASNNNTMIQCIKTCCHKAGIKFQADHAQMWCMPHTIHFAAIRLLEGISLISKGNSNLATSSKFNYQDDINTGLEHENDMEATPEDSKADDEQNSTACSDKICMAIQKLHKIIKSVQSSPQCHQHWNGEIERMNAELNVAEHKAILMLILNVKTCWLSTHQMLHKFSTGVFYYKIIN